MAQAINKLTTDIILYWTLPKSNMIVTPIPRNNITISGFAKRRIYLKFRSFNPIDALEIRAVDKSSGLDVNVNGKAVLVTRAYDYKRKDRIVLVFDYPGL